MTHLAARLIGLLSTVLVCMQGAQAQQSAPGAPASQPSTIVSPNNVKCAVPRELARFAAPLPNLARAVAKGRNIPVIALGSSSTAGSGASGPQASYPARLDAELDRRFPGNDFMVSNFGVGGHVARDMLERLQANIIPMHPALVIWQTGVNDAIQDVGIEAFREILDRGIRETKAEGIDIILVNMQYYPRSERVAGYADYLAEMRKAAEHHNIPLFRRFAIMKHLVKSGQHTTEELLAPDNFHLNDLSYGCLADLLADAIEDQIKAGRVNASQLQKR